MEIEDPREHWKTCATCGLPGHRRHQVLTRQRLGAALVLAVGVIVGLTHSPAEGVVLAGFVALLGASVSVRNSR